MGAGLSSPEEQLLPGSPGVWLGAEHPAAAASAPAAPLHRLLPPPQSNNIEKAVSAAHTFLQKNPKHEMTLQYLNYYRTMLDVDEYLVDLEAQPYEVRRGQGWGPVRAWCCRPPRAAALPRRALAAHLLPPEEHLRGVGAGAGAVSGGAGQAAAPGGELSGARLVPGSRYSCGR